MQDKIFTPFTFPTSQKVIPNRIALAPMTNLQSHEDGTLSEEEYQWLVRRAKEHFGMIITCAANVSADGQGWQGELGVYDDRHLGRLNRLAKGIKDNGSLAVVQIFHGGARSPENLINCQPWSASAHTMPYAKNPVAIRAAECSDIERVIDDFVRAAKRIERAGCDGVELHGAHGYLLHQFLSTATNYREDEWGGSFENRIRLLRTILSKIKAEVKSNFLIGVRISPEDKYTFQGIDFDESIELCKILASDGAGYIHLSPWDAFKKPDKYPDDNKHLITYFREAAPELPIVVAGGIWDREGAERALDFGADIVAIGMGAIGHANWPTLIKNHIQPPKPPYSTAHLREQNLSPTFIEYMKRWKGFVAEAEGGK